MCSAVGDATMTVAHRENEQNEGAAVCASAGERANPRRRRCPSAPRGAVMCAGRTGDGEAATIPPRGGDGDGGRWGKRSVPKAHTERAQQCVGCLSACCCWLSKRPRVDPRSAIEPPSEGGDDPSWRPSVVAVPRAGTRGVDDTTTQQSPVVCGGERRTGDRKSVRWRGPGSQDNRRRRRSVDPSLSP